MENETLPPASRSSVESTTAQFFSLSDRVGRVRYFVYILGAMLACGFMLVFIYLVGLLLPTTLSKLISVTSFILVKNVMFPLIVFVMSIRRLHDFDLSGWWSLLVLIPFVTLALLFIPGKKLANRFGPPPAPNPTSLLVTAVALPLALLGLYFFVVSVNPEVKAPVTTDSDGKPALPRYSPN
ncbi:MAG: DUF805 domain-containing protein [Burkholderiaceae bacterium]|nr:DUF805 domain-containing protein [Sulfuritalea sp.]MCF8173941.1 DUF805 domain-containing protein [Burkholderiaceae bacterium]